MIGRFSLLSRFVSVAWLIVVYSFLYIPILVFFIFSFNSAPFPAPWLGFTLHWYKALLYESDIWMAVANSLIVALSAVVLSSCMGIFVLLYAVNRGSYLKNIAIYFYGNLIVPEIVFAVGLLGFLTALKVPLGCITLIIAHTILGLGYIVPILYFRYLELDYRLLEAAQDLGASPWQAFFTVVVPLLKPSLVGAALLVFLISFDDFVLAYFCSGTTFQTLPLYILSMLRVGVSPIVNAFSTLLLLLSGIVVLIYSSIALREDRIF